jgi:nucleoside-diphosphate-sugar epimerase
MPGTTSFALVIELIGSRSDAVFGPLRVDDPQGRQPDIARARDLLGWESQVGVSEDLTRPIEHYGRMLPEAVGR